MITGGPNQDIMDSMTANVFDTFLGISHVNCLLCHNGRGHLDTLSLWGSQHHPLSGLAAGVVISRAPACPAAIPVDPTNKSVYYWVGARIMPKDSPPITR